ncbi:esterase-like activity of phytase family protein [Phormidesmis sp. 146-35]
MQIFYSWVLGLVFKKFMTPFCSALLKRSGLWAIVLLSTLLTACSLPQVSAEDRLFLPISVEFLEAYTLPKTTFQDTPVGGLSALTYDRPQNLFYAVSDDRSDRTPARFYTMALALNPDKSKIETVSIKAVTTLKTETGQPFEKGTIDAEGIALSPIDSLFISSEGVVRDGVAPFIGEFDLKTGQLKRKLPIPEAFLPDDSNQLLQKRGIQDNAGFEPLTLNAGAASMGAMEPYRLFTATESSLIQDLEPANANQGAKNRLLHYLVEDDRFTLISQHLYPLEPKPVGAFDQGLSELLAIDQAGHFLSLERSFGLQGFQVKLFQIATGSATDISTIASLKGTLKGTQPIRKRLLLDFNQLDIPIDNLEGMAIGPRLSDGSQSLILVSDDNFNSLNQVTQFLLLRLKGKV